MKDHGIRYKMRPMGDGKAISEDNTAEQRKKSCLYYRPGVDIENHQREVTYVGKNVNRGGNIHTDVYFSDSSECSPNVRRVPKEYKIDARRLNFESEVSQQEGLKLNKGKRPVKRQREFVDVDSPVQIHDGKGVNIQFHVEGEKRIKSKVPKKKDISSKEIWLSSDSDGPSINQQTTRLPRFANIRVKKSDCYYRSNLQTTVKEIKSLNLSEAHLYAIKLTPFWFLVNAIRESDEDTLIEITKKHESDMRMLIQKYDILNIGIPLRETLVEITKRDIVLIFGVIDGKGSIRLTTTFERTPWMTRCFPEIMKYKGTKNMPSMKKFSILTELRRMTRMNDKLYAQDVARLIHCYLLASLFMPNGNTSIPWCVCEYLEDFSSICTYDWSSLIVSQLNRQMATTRTMKLAGCAMLLPYWLCEHTRIISPSREHAFPRFMRWNLNTLHQKLYRRDLDTSLSRNEIMLTIRPTSAEKAAFRDLNAFQMKSPVKIDVDTPRPAYESNREEHDDTIIEDTGTDDSENVSIEKGEDDISFGFHLDDDCDAEEIRPKRRSPTNVEFNDEVDITCSNVPSSIQYESVGGSRNVNFGEKEKFNCSTDAFILQPPTFEGWVGNSKSAECYRSSLEKDGFVGEIQSDEAQHNQSFDDSIGNMAADIPDKFEEDKQLKLEKHISLLNDEILKLRNEVKKITGEKILCDIQLGTVTRCVEDKEREILQLSSNISCLNEKLANINKSYCMSEAFSREAIADGELVKNWQCEAEMLKEQNKKMLEERDKFKSLIHDLKYDIEKCSGDYELKKKELDVKIVELEGSNEQIQNEYNLLKKVKETEVGNLEDKVKWQMEKIDSLTTMNCEMDGKIQILNNQISQLNDDVNNFKNADNVKDRESELTEAKRWLSELRSAYDSLKHEYESIRNTCNNIEEQKSKEIQDLETTIHQKNDAIQLLLKQHSDLTGKVKNLLNEKDELERKCNELMNPSYTQIFNSSQSHRLCDMVAELNDEKEGARIAEDYMKKLLEELDTKNGRIKNLENMVRRLYEYNHNNMKIPANDPDFVELQDKGKSEPPAAVSKNSRKSKEQVNHTAKEWGSIERGVKIRDDRKPKTLSPLGKQIVNVVDSVEEYPKGKFQFRWDRNCWAVAKCGGAVMEKMRVKQLNNDNSPIWSGEGPYAKVYVVDALKVLHDETISYMIVDSWGELLTVKLAEIKKPTKAYVFTSHSLEVLNSGEKDSDVAKYFNLQLMKCVHHEVLVFPLRNEVDNETDKKSWTMLKYQMRNATWTYYNPQSCNKKVLNNNRVNDLITYIETRLNRYLIEAKKNIPLAKMLKSNDNPVEICAFTPQMVQGSLDSGVIVCHIMEKTLKKHSVSSLHNNNGVYLTSTAGNYRCRMVESFISPETMKDMN